MARRDLGAEWITSISQLAAAYGLDENTMQQRVYALSEQIHSHYCFSRGPVNHAESRPDEHIAAGILGALVGVDWWLVRGGERVSLVTHSDSTPEFFGDLSRHDVEDDIDTPQG
jgi:hypothetical protein